MAERERIDGATLRRTFRDVKRACYAGLDSITLREEVARRASPVLFDDAYVLTTADPETGLLTHAVGAGLPEAMQLAFVQQVYPAAEAVLFQELARSGQSAATIDIAGRGSARPGPFHSAAYRDLLREFGFGAELRATLCADDGMWGVWCVMRGGAGAPFRDREVRFARRIAGHIGRGLRSAALLDLARGAPQDEPPGEPLQPGVVVLDPRGRITLQTPVAGAQLADVADHAGWSGPLPFAVRQLIGRLHAQMREGERDPDAPADASLRMRGQSGRWYTVRASLAEPDAEGDAATVVVIQRAERHEMAGVLTLLYGLSSREREVLALAARGESTKRIAARLGISAYTVQDHLGRACEKVGVRGRKQLLAKLFFDACAPALGA